ncbi:MAG TPA: AsmA family protein, partial [Bacteroidia bacterium]
MHKLKKVLIIFICTIVIIVVAIILFISPIAKYLIEKYDEKYTGRQITLDRAYVNPFTGYVHLSNLKIYELKSDSVFFSAKGVSASISLFKLFSKTYEISNITLDQPHGTIIQNKKDLNFNDLIERFSSKDSSNISKAPIHFNILNIKINDGEFYYRELITPINYFIKNVNIESSGKHWDEDTIVAKFSCLPGIGSGDAKGDFTVNVKTNDYRSAIVIHKLDLKILDQYLKELINYGNFSANLDLDMKASGNLSDKLNLTAVGMMAFNDFHLGKKKGDDYASFDRIVITIKEMSPRKFIYNFDSLTLSNPYLKYELYDHLDNLQTMFGKNGSNVKEVKDDPTKFNLVIEIARYFNELGKNFFES